MKNNASAGGSGVAVKVAFFSILVNLVLSVLKILAGLFFASGAMVSDGVHSASDVFSSIVVIFGIRLSAKEPDKNHPYGHERFESVAAIVLATVLVVTGVLIAKSAIELLIDGTYRESELPGIPALVAAIVSIAVKEGMFWVTRHYAKATRSDALMADAWHHRSDALSSIGALIGIAGARMGFPVLEPVASLVICLMILKAAADIFREAMRKMVDRSSDPETEAAIRALAESEEGVLRVDMLRTREFGNRMYIELEIALEDSLSLAEAHRVAELVHDDVEKSFPLVKHIMIHVNPYTEPDGE